MTDCVTSMVDAWTTDLLAFARYSNDFDHLRLSTPHARCHLRNTPNRWTIASQIRMRESLQFLNRLNVWRLQ
ncbi:hypothetical protein D918_01968 [Trichuris suis]|nr:hypothetical protein D918_01968 [Trichuris suis]